MPLYKINAVGPTHRRRENGVMVVYANRGREGERGEIELTQDQAEGPNYRHLRLTPANGSYEVKGPAKKDETGDDDGLEKLTKKELQELCSANGIGFETDANKAALIEALRANGVKAEVKPQE
ncbi:MAG: SAP domain-containing protein [Xanthobacteraceae bacterium]